MIDLTGYLKLNNVDVWTQYRAFLCELSVTDHTNMDELQKSPKMKAYTTVSFRELDGEELPDELPSPRYEAIDRTLQFCIIGTSQEDRMAKYKAFMDVLKTGWLVLDVKGVHIYKVYHQEQSVLTWYDDPTTPACVFKVKFREPKPGTV